MLLTRLSKSVATALSLATLAGAAFASYPEKSVKLVLPLGAGGSHDQNAQVFTSILPLYLGQSIELEFLPGDNGKIGTSTVVDAAPDGYTLLFSQNYFDMLQQHVDALPYDPMEDLIPIARINYAPSTIVVRADSPFDTYQELIAASISKPGAYTISHSGDWGATFVPAAQIMNATGTEFRLKPYEGGGNAMAALMTGEVDVTMAFPSAIAPLLASGEVKVLATAGADRLFPEIPSFGELGLSGDIGFMHRVVFAPAGTPPKVVLALSRALESMLADPAYVQLMAELGENIDYLDSASYQQMRVNQNEAYRSLVDAMAN